MSSRPVFSSLPALVYSIGGAADTRGVGGDSYRLGAFSNTGAGVRGSPRVILTKVFVLLRSGKGYRYSYYLCFRCGRLYLLHGKSLSL